MVQVTGTGIMIVIETGSEIDTENENEIEIVTGLEKKMLEVVGMEDEEWIGGPGMAEKEVGIGTEIGAGHVLLLGMVAEGHLEVQLVHIRGLC